MTRWTTAFWGSKGTTASHGSSRLARRRGQRRLGCEILEGRTLLTVAPASGGLNTDYTLMGGQWNNTQPITFSIAPDGVAWDQGVNGINSQLNSEFGSTSWQRLVATALQTWAASANLNFVATSDGAYSFNAPGQGQGDPRFGDIRVGGYGFAGDDTIALTYGPPPNGNTAGGDVKLNLDYNFGPGGQWDLETTLIHELGHSLGLGESPQFDSVMYTYYSGVRHDLTSYDVEGIQSLYGPRQADSYQVHGQATSPATAADVTGSLGGGLSGQVAGLSLNAVGASEDFTVTAPATTTGTMLINAVANGQSLLSPKVTVIDPISGQILATDAHPDQYGNTASVSLSGVQPGHRYLITVTGATSDVFSVGNYSLQMGFSGVSGGPTLPTTPTSPVTIAPVSTTPVDAPPVTYPTTPTGTITLPTAPVAQPITTPTTPPAATSIPTNLATVDPYSAHTTTATPAELGPIAQQLLTSQVTLPTAQAIRVFAFETTGAGPVQIASSNARVTILDASGAVVTGGQGLLAFVAPQAGSRYLIVVSSPNGAAVGNANFAIVAPSANASVATYAVGNVNTPSATPTKVKVGHATPTRNKHKVAHRSHR